jgi:hypothetical protein
MRAIHWLMIAVLGLPIVGCGRSSTAPSPITQEPSSIEEA